MILKLLLYLILAFLGFYTGWQAHAYLTVRAMEKDKGPEDD